MKINNKYITIKNNDDYLLDLIEIIKTKRKEDKVKNKNLNININYSLSQGKKKYLKKPKIIKKIFLVTTKVKKKLKVKMIYQLKIRNQILLIIFRILMIQMMKKIEHQKKYLYLIKSNLINY